MHARAAPPVFHVFHDCDYCFAYGEELAFTYLDTSTEDIELTAAAAESRHGREALQGVVCFLLEEQEEFISKFQFDIRLVVSLANIKKFHYKRNPS